MKIENIEDIKLTTGIELQDVTPDTVFEKLKEIKFEDTLPIGPLQKTFETSTLFMVINQITKDIAEDKPRIKFSFKDGDLTAEFSYLEKLQQFNISKCLEKADLSQISITNKETLDCIFKFFLSIPGFNKHYVNMPGADENKLLDFYKAREQEYKIELIKHASHLVELYAVTVYTGNFYIMLLFMVMIQQGVRNLSSGTHQIEDEKIFTKRVETIPKDAPFFSKRLDEITKTGMIRESGAQSTAVLGAKFEPEVSGEIKAFTLLRQSAPSSISAHIYAISLLPQEMEELFYPGTRFAYSKAIKVDNNYYFVCTPIVTPENYAPDYKQESIITIQNSISENLDALKEIVNSIKIKTHFFCFYCSGGARDFNQKANALIREINLFKTEYVNFSDLTFSEKLKSIEKSKKLLPEAEKERYLEKLQQLRELCTQLIINRPAQLSMSI